MGVNCIYNSRGGIEKTINDQGYCVIISDGNGHVEKTINRSGGYETAYDANLREIVRLQRQGIYTLIIENGQTRTVHTDCQLGINPITGELQIEAAQD